MAGSKIILFLNLHVDSVSQAVADNATSENGKQKKQRSRRRNRKKFAPSTEELRFGLVPASNYWKYTKLQILSSPTLKNEIKNGANN